VDASEIATSEAETERGRMEVLLTPRGSPGKPSGCWPRW
jgi:hypothetical protein